MREVHQLEIKVGLLVVAGLVVTIALVLTADKIRIERTYKVSAYLQDAGGLRYESPVTLSGIAVGKVRAIEFLAPGSTAPGKVRATVEISQGVVLPADVEAKLATSGVFGDSSLALAAPAKPSGALLAVDGSGTVVVQPGFLDRAVDRAGGILTAVEDLLDQHTRDDAKRLIGNAADLAGHASAVAARLDAQQERIASILANLDHATAQLDGTMTTLNARLDPLLARVTTTLDQVDALVAGAQAPMDGIAGLVAGVRELTAHIDRVLGGNEERLATLLTEVAGAARKAQDIAAALQGGEGILGQLLMNRDLAADLNHLAVDMESAAKQVADKPSRLVFDDKDSERQKEQTRRDREKMRRTLAEGLGQPVAPAAGAPAASAPAAPPAAK